MLDRLPWILLALLHLTPALALARPAMIEALYGVSGDSAAFPLIQHRAALFVAILAICLWAAIDPGVRRLASVVCAISMLSFLVVHALAGFPAALSRIAWADLIFLPVLVFAAARAWS